MNGAEAHDVKFIKNQLKNMEKKKLYFKKLKNETKLN